MVSDTNLFYISRVLDNLEHEPPEKVEVSLSMPLKDGDEWYCKFKIKSKQQLSDKIYGVDPFQALTLSLELIRKHLAENYKVLQWPGGSIGDHGFPLLVPSFLDKAVINKLEKFIDVELERTETYK